VYDFHPSAPVGAVIRPVVAQPSDIVVSGSVSSLPLVFGIPCIAPGKAIHAVGSLAVVPGAEGTNARCVPPGSEDVVVFSVRLTAGSPEAVSIRSLSLIFSGPSNQANPVQAARLFLDANGDDVYQPTRDLPVGGPAPGWGLGSSIRFSTDFEVPPVSSATVFVVCEIDPLAETGAHVVAFFDPSTDVGAQGTLSGFPPSVSGAPCNGGTITIGPVGSVWTLGEDSGVSETALPGAEGTVLFRVELTTGTSEPVLLESLHFEATGPVEDLAGLTAAFLFLDEDGDARFNPSRDRLLSGPFLPDSGRRRIDAPCGAILPPGSTTTIFLVANLRDDALEGSIFRFAIQNGADVRATGTLTSHRANVVGIPVTGREVRVAMPEDPVPCEGACGGGTSPQGPQSLLGWAILALCVGLLWVSSRKRLRGAGSKS
jgi:hypothetical protein